LAENRVIVKADQSERYMTGVLWLLSNIEFQFIATAKILAHFVIAL